MTQQPPTRSIVAAPQQQGELMLDAEDKRAFGAFEAEAEAQLAGAILGEMMAKIGLWGVLKLVWRVWLHRRGLLGAPRT